MQKCVTQIIYLGPLPIVRRDAEQDYESDPEHPYAVGPPPSPALGPGQGSSCFGVDSYAHAARVARAGLARRNRRPPLG